MKVKALSWGGGRPEHSILCTRESQIKYLSQYLPRYLSGKLQREAGETFVRIVITDRKTIGSRKGEGVEVLTVPQPLSLKES